MSDSLSGRLLIAGPSLGDPNFDRTIVYLLDHGPEGALGVVINRSTDLDVADTVLSWATVAPPPAVLFSGGPVEAGVLVGLARVRDPIVCPGWSSVEHDVGTVDLAMDPGAIVAGVEAARLFAGYAGWGPGQLDDEIAGGAWFVVEAEPGDLFTPEPEHLWGTVLRRNQDHVALAAGNPSWN